MADEYAIVVGTFTGGERKDTIQKALRAKGYVITNKVTDATLMVAGKRPGKKLTFAKRRRIRVIGQADVAALEVLAADDDGDTTGEEPRRRPKRAPVTTETIMQEATRLAALPGTSERWARLWRVLDLLPASSGALAEVVDAIAASIDRWPVHFRIGSPDHQLAALEGRVDPRLRLTGSLVVKNILDKHSVADAQRILDARAELLPGARCLCINHLRRDGDWQELLTPENLAGFEEVTLPYCELGRAGLERVLAAVDRERLEVLDLRSNTLESDDAAVIAEAGLSRLRWLHFYGNKLKDAGVRTLCAAPSLRNLEFLALSYNYLKSPAAEHLAAATFASSLRGLKLDYNDLFARGAATLAKAPLSELRLLNLSATELGDKGLSALARSRHLDALETLVVEGNRAKPLISSKGLQALAKGKGMPALRALNLQGNDVTGEGVEALLRSERRSALKELTVVNNDVDFTQAMFLKEPELPVTLETLEISFDGDGKKKFCKLLAGAEALRGLEKLVIRPPWSMQDDPEVTAALLSNPHLATIADLELRDFCFDRPTVRQLARTPFSRLRRVWFSSPSFTSADYRTLASAPWATSVEDYVVSDSAVPRGASAMKALFKGTMNYFYAF